MGLTKKGTSRKCVKCRVYPTYSKTDRFQDTREYCLGCKKPEELCNCKKRKVQADT